MSSRTQHPQKHADLLGGMRIRYIDVGKSNGEPPLLLLHGLASRIEEYEELITALEPAHRRIIVLDLPGNGFSDKPDRPYTLALMEDASLALLDHLELDRVNVAGGSLGGNLTLRLGARQPERFAKLVAWAPAGVWKPHVIWSRLLQLFPRHWLFWPLLRIQSRYWFLRSWPGRKRALEEAFEHFREVYCEGYVRMYCDLGFEQIRTSIFPIAPTIRQSTLLLWGDQDNGLDMGAGIKRLVGMMPDARLVVFEGARHSLASEVPTKLAQSMSDFLVAH